MMYPGLTSWAKFSRPCGTKFVSPGSHTLFSPYLTLEIRQLLTILRYPGAIPQLLLMCGVLLIFFCHLRLLVIAVVNEHAIAKLQSTFPQEWYSCHPGEDRERKS